MNKAQKVNYLVKRLGIKKTIMHYLGKKDNEYICMYDHYYSKLKKDQYLNELCEWYDYALGRKSDCVTNPKTFNDKIQWMKLNCVDEIRTVCSDKFAVREYIKNAIGEDYLIPLLGKWDLFSDIDFDRLPQKFVLKSNTGSGRIIIVSDNQASNPTFLKRELDMWQRIPFGYNGMEIQYLPIVRSIIAEQYIEEMDGSLHDYKFHCFNGAPALVEFMGERDLVNHTSTETWCDINFNPLNIVEKLDGNFANYTGECKKPKNYDKMLEIVRILCEPFMYVRVDLYNLEGKILFGELTFTPDNGLDQWETEDTDEKIGRLLILDPQAKQTEENLLKQVHEFFEN